MPKEVKLVSAHYSQQNTFTKELNNELSNGWELEGILGYNGVNLFQMLSRDLPVSKTKVKD